ncbi:4-hydroxythreonine-4-phosphate dehydrogenase PdxA [bacterium]|nr:4-hydroxythreonine-4-phosphate dehydrogenase PdxA [bacterium]
MNKPVLAVTMGDPAGVGPEITVKALADPLLRERVCPLVVGVAQVLTDASALLGNPLRVETVASPEEALRAPADVLSVLEPPTLAPGEYPRAQIDARCGEAAFRSIELAIQIALAGQVAAVVTNPLHKTALQLAGHHYAGHTEIFRDLTGAGSSAMMLVAQGLRVVHVTTHCSLHEAAARCRTKRILQVTRLAHEALLSLGIPSPRLGMAALNPHAGEAGLFGNEEREQILPAVEAARKEGLDVSDPLPADTIFCLALGGRFDAVIAQYHDQGHIPVKLLGFHYDDRTGQWTSVSGINVTLGLPILRVSVDHGTAFDQAWRGQANPESLHDALDFALQMTTARGR